MKINVSNFHTSVIFISTLFASVESGMIFPQQTEPVSQVSGADVIAVVKNLNDYDKVQLQLLYDSRFSGTLSTIAMEFSPLVAGIMVFQGNITSSLFSVMLQSATEPTYLLAFCSPEKVVEIFEEIRRRRLKSHLVEWVVFAEDPESVNSMMENLNGILHEGTHITIFAKEDKGRFSIFASSLTDDGNIEFHHKGVWRSTKGQDGRRKPLHHLMASTEEKYYSNMRGRMLTIAALSAWPYFGLGNQLLDESYEVDAGIEVSVVKTLSSALNFTYRAFRPPSGAPGYPQPDGTVTGVIGMVARREADMGVCLMALNEKRATVVDFTFPHFREPLSISSNAPGLKNRALAILSSFTFEVWIYIITAVIIMGLLIYILSEMSCPTEKKTSKSRSVDVYVFNVFRNIVVQGNTIHLQKWSQRVLFFSWYLFCLVISASYSGMLTAVLAIPSYETPIDYLKDLPKAVKEGYTLSVMADSTNEYIFKEATSGIYKQIWPLFNHKDRSQSFVSSPVTGMARILKRKYVYLGPFLISRVLAMKMGGSKFYFGRQKFFAQDIALALPQGAPYKKVFDKTLMRIVEGGFVMKWREDEFRKMPQLNSGEGDGQSTTSAISLTHLQAATYIVIVGYLVGSVALFVERIVYSLERK